MSSNDQTLNPSGDVQPLERSYNGDVSRREPPGEAFPPYMPLVGEESPDAVWARFMREHSGLCADIREYVALTAQRAAPANEQVYAASGILLNGAALDLDLGQVPLNLYARVHRIVLTGTAADVPTISLYADGAQGIGNALGTWNPGALNADGLAMVTPDDLHLPKGRRLIARLRAGVSINPIFVAIYTRTYPA